MDLEYTLNLSDRYVSGAEFVQRRPEVAIPYATLLVIAMVCGTAGNILVIVTVACHKKLRTLENCFIVNLAVADLCVTALVDPFSIVGIFLGNSFFKVSPILCEIVASVCLTSCFCSLLSIGAISINRFFHICHRDLYSKIYTKKSCTVMIIGLWLISFLLEMPNFIGWGDHVFDEKTRSCVWDRTADFSYTLFFALVGVVLPLGIISLCYVKIFLFVRRMYSRIAKTGKATTEELHDEKTESIRLTKTLFIIFVVFVICWAPYAIIVVLDVNDSYPIELHAISILLAHANSSVNSFIYGVFNRAFRQGYKDIFYQLGCYRPLVTKGRVVRFLAPGMYKRTFGDKQSRPFIDPSVDEIKPDLTWV